MKEPVTKEQLVKQLREAGLREGDIVMTHSSLSKLVNIEGGPKTVVEALITAVGQSGTILVPTFTGVDKAIAADQSGNPIDLRIAPTHNGIISETLRNFPGAKRSSHPFSSVTALGAQADYITRDHQIDPRICHSDSPFGRLLELNGKICGLGVTLGPVSFYHVIEDTWSEFPYKPYGEPFRVRYIDPYGKRIDREVKAYESWFSTNRIDRLKGEWFREKFARYLIEKGLLKPFTFGYGPSWIIETRTLYNAQKHLAKRGITIYLNEERWNDMGNPSF